MGGFAEYYGTTNIHPVGLVAILVLGLLVLSLPRNYALIPFIIAACTIPMAQRIVVGGADFTLLRILLVIASLRVVARNEAKGMRWNGMDSLIIAWCVSGTVVMLMQYGIGMLMNRAGWAFNIIGTYFVTRCLVRSWEDVTTLARSLAFIAIGASFAFFAERVTRYNAFSVFGGVHAITQVREGRMRCQGAFAHPILAGTFWAAAMPLIWMLRYEGARAKQLCIAGSVASLGIVVACASSTPVMSVATVGGVTALFHFRLYRKTMWMSGIALLFVLHLLMNKPVWHLLARVDIVGGSTGWHRYVIFDAFINNFSKWYALGETNVLSWGVWQMRDITNQYMIEGLRGGLVTLLVFVVILCIGFQYVGRMLRQAKVQRLPVSVEWKIWLLGAALFMHVVTFFAVSYFGQMITIFYIQLGLIACMYQCMQAKAVPQAMVRPAGALAEWPASGALRLPRM